MVNIIYPSLVEQAASFLKREGIKAEKDEIYKEMIKNGTIDQYGNPTSMALNEGLVSDYTEKKNMRLVEFKRMYPVFKEFSAKEFVRYDGVWYISETINQILDKRCENKEYEEHSIEQIAAYFKQRNYDNPQTPGEFKGCFYPMYEGISNDHFVFKDGNLALDVYAIKQSCENVLSGKVKGNREAAKELMEYMENLKD